MADEEGDPSMNEDISQRHKLERKALLAQTQKLKHSIPKGDKKKKKEITAQIALLEEELNQKHEKELTEYETQASATNDPLVDSAASQLNDLTTNEEASDSPKKMSKAQRRKEKKADQEQEREERIQAQDLENLTGARHLEMEKLKALLNKRNLRIFEVPSDGNCLYTAIKDQLGRRSFEASTPMLRQQTAEHMLSNPDDFLPFLTNPNSGEPLTIEEFRSYCDEVADTPAWGGQLELRALSVILQTPIEVVQADVPSIKIGEEYENLPLIVSYHRHIYGLGEHYNSVIEKLDEEEEDAFN